MSDVHVALGLREDDLALAWIAHLPGRDPTHDAMLLDDALDLGGTGLTLRRLGSPSEVPLGAAELERLGGGGLRARAVIFAQRADAIVGLPYLSVGVSLGDGRAGVTPVASWVSVTDRPTFEGQPPYRLTRVGDPQAWQRLLRGAYQAVHVPGPGPGEGLTSDDAGEDYHVEWWHRDDPGLAP